MAAQSLLSLGIDVAKFDADRQAIKISYEQLFAELKSLGNVNISLIGGANLTELTASMDKMNKVLVELNSNMAKLGTTTTTTGNANTAATGSINQTSAALTRQAESLTAIQTAQTNLAAKTTTAAQAVSTAAQASIAHASAEDKATVAVLAHASAENTLLAASSQLEAATRQQELAENQLAVAVQRVATADNGKSQAEKTAAFNALTRAEIDLIQANAAVVASETAIERASAEVSSVLAAQARIQKEAVESRVKSYISLYQEQTRDAEIQTRLGRQNIQTANTELKAAESKVQNAKASEKAAAATELNISRQKLLFVATEQVSKADFQRARADNELANAEIRLARAQDERQISLAKISVNSAKGSVASAIVEQEKANRDLISAQQAVNKEVEVGTNVFGAFGRTLTSGLGTLRTLAYILPGLGIAGIFNLAFEAIGSALESLELFTSASEKQIDLEDKITKSLLEQKEAYKAIREEREKLSSITNSGSSFNLGFQIDNLQAAGVERGVILNQKYILSTKELEEATTRLEGSFDNLYFAGVKNISIQDKANLGIKTTIEIIKLQEDALKRLQNVSDNPSDLSAISTAQIGVKKIVGSDFTNLDAETLKKAIDLKKTQISSELSANKERLSNFENYLKAENKVQTSSLEYFKYVEDEKIKYQLEHVKNRVELQKQAAQEQFKFEGSSLKDRLDALNKENKAEKDLIAANLKAKLDNISTTGQTDPNGTEVKRAEDEARTARAKADSDTEVKRAQEIEKSRQRVLEANKTIDVNLIEQEKSKELKISENLQQFQEDRIKSLDRYYDLVRKKQDIELARKLDTLPIQAAGEAPSVERQEAESTRRKNILDAQADAEKKFYAVVKSEADDALKTVLADIHIQEEAEQFTFAYRLAKLNESYLQGKVSLRKFLKDRETLTDEFTTKNLAAQTVDDTNAIIDLMKTMKDNGFTEDDVKKAQADYDKAISARDAAKNTGGDTLDDAELEVAKYKGILDAKVDANLKYTEEIKKQEKQLGRNLSDYEKSLVNDKIKKDKEDLERRKIYLQLLIDLEKKLYEAVKQYVDRGYENRLNRLEKERAQYDENADKNIEAIQKSTLSEKEKTANDIQLSQQKLENDKRIAAEEKRIRHDKAVADKALALAQITIETALAVVKTLAGGGIYATPLAIAVGALGAAQFAVAAATPIPEYAKGTPIGGHKGGLARYGEAGPELVKEPYKSPYMVNEEHISFLPAGTEVIPMTESPDFSTKRNAVADGWEQTRWLGKIIRKTLKPANVTVNVTGSNDKYRKQILGN